MRLALLPGLLLALAMGSLASGSSTALAAARPNTNSHMAALFSIAAQAVTTLTPTTSATTPTIGSATGTSATAIATVTTPITSATAGTGSVSPTATLMPLTTITPPGQGGRGGSLKLNPFDWAFLTSAPDPSMGPLAWASLLLMVALFGISAYFYLYKRPLWKRSNTLYFRAANRWAPVGLWLAILGLLLLLFRIIPLDFFNLRFWLYLWLLATVASAGYFAYWYRTVYPKEVARYQKTQRARQYMPGSAKAAGRTTTSRSTSITTAKKTTAAPTQRTTASGSTKKRKKG